MRLAVKKVLKVAYYAYNTHYNVVHMICWHSNSVRLKNSDGMLVNGVSVQEPVAEEVEIGP